MRRRLTLLTLVLFSTATTALAQPASEPRVPVWDVTLSAAVFQGRPGISESERAYGDDWYSAARFSAAVGRYWTPHLKTEVEFAASTEGRLFIQRFATVPGSATPFPYGVQEFFQTNQGTARVVWQFLENRWVHPYVSGGVTFIADRRRTVVDEPYRYLDPRQPGSSGLVIPQHTEGPHTDFQTGAIVGAGAKLYMTPSTFANAGVFVTRARPSRSVSLILGFGWDF
jgi:hypothetical protein